MVYIPYGYVECGKAKCRVEEAGKEKWKPGI